MKSKFEPLSRRRFICMASATVAAVSCMPSRAFASLPDAPRELKINNLHTGEWLESCYFDGVSYVEEELARLDHLCRDFRQNEAHPIDRRLFDQLTQIQALIGTQNQVQIISGYRSPVTNAALRARSSAVAKKSYHMLGKAIDFRIDGVAIATVHEAALALNAGGVGYYPRSDFVHIDSGPVRQW